MEHIFYLKIENDIHSARVTPVTHPGHSQLYHVLFEDGYENIFFTDVETGNWMEEDLGETALAADFGKKVRLISDFSCLPYKALSWCKASLGQKLVNFGFYVYKEDQETIFDIYADNHKFLCSLIKNRSDAWQFSAGNFTSIKNSGYTKQVKLIMTILNSLTK